MSKKMKWSIAGVAGAGIVALVALTAFKKDGSAAEVRIEPVASRDLVASVTASGQIQPRTKVDLSADITGKIVRLAVKEGQEVTKGQFLLEIDPQQYQAALQRSQAALASARAEQAQVGRELHAGGAELQPHGGDPEGECRAGLGRIGGPAEDRRWR